jgi:hypothetical protein
LKTPRQRLADGEFLQRLTDPGLRLLIIQQIRCLGRSHVGGCATSRFGFQQLDIKVRSLLRQASRRRLGSFSGTSAYVTDDRRLMVTLPFLQSADCPNRPHFIRQIGADDRLPPPPFGSLKRLVRFLAIEHRLECKLSCVW